jgi:hypothetical protein
VRGVEDGDAVESRLLFDISRPSQPAETVTANPPAGYLTGCHSTETACLDHKKRTLRFIPLVLVLCLRFAQGGTVIAVLKTGMGMTARDNNGCINCWP